MAHALVREFDLPNTMRTRGLTVFVDKPMIAVAGERLAEPKRVQETSALRSALAPTPGQSAAGAR